MNSSSFQFNKEDLGKSLKVLGWSLGSALITFAMAMMSSTTFPDQYVWAVPIINTVLFMLYQFVKDNSSLQNK